MFSNGAIAYLKPVICSNEGLVSNDILIEFMRILLTDWIITTTTPNLL